MADDLVRPRPAFGRALRVPAVTFNILNVHVGGNMAEEETNSVHALVAFVFFMLLGFLQIRYPQIPTAFQVHPKTMLLSIASFVVYCLAYWVRLKFTVTWVTDHFDTLMEMSGSLSLISLLLMLLPDTWGSSPGFIIYTSWFVSHVLIRLRQQMKRKAHLGADRETYQSGPKQC